MTSSSVDRVKPQDHHKQCELCTTRAKYRQGKEFKAVKVYTINQESCHLILQNIPAVGLGNELKKLCGGFGQVESCELIPNYPAFDEFTDTFYVKYASLKEARFAKKKLDNRSFYGGLIHICYAPELETVQECREKLIQREQYVKRYVDPYSLSLAKCKSKEAQSESVQSTSSSLNKIPVVSTAKNNKTHQPHSGNAWKGSFVHRIQQLPLLSSAATTVTGAALFEKTGSSQSPPPLLQQQQSQQLFSSAPKQKLPTKREENKWSSQKDKGRANRKESASDIRESEKITIAPQQWSRTGQQSTIGNLKPSPIQSYSAAAFTKTGNVNVLGEKGLIGVQEAFFNAMAGTSALSISYSQPVSRTSTTPSSTSFSQPQQTITNDKILLTQTQTYNQVKPKPFSQTRIVFHLQKKRNETRTTEDDTATNKRRKEDDGDGKPEEKEDKK